MLLSKEQVLPVAPTTFSAQDVVEKRFNLSNDQIVPEQQIYSIFNSLRTSFTITEINPLKKKEDKNRPMDYAALKYVPHLGWFHYILHLNLETS